MSLKPVKQSYFSMYFLLPMIVILGCMALALWVMPAPAFGAMPDCIDSTCRVTAGDGGRGTGSVFLIENDQVYVLTNAHVATTIRVELEFWSDGHLSKKIFGSTVLRSVSRDIAVISIEADLFGRFPPTAIPLAPLNTKLHQGQAVTSVGCAKGAWATAWRGHVHGVPSDGRIAFNPTPEFGRSGSAIYDAAGEHIVALLQAQRLDGPGGRPIYGLAIDIDTIYAAIYGKMVKTTSTVRDREIFWPPAKQVQPPVQCGPRGCPTPQGQGRGYVLPYRQKQQQIDRRQDKQIQDLYPTKPFTPPEIKIELLPPPPPPFEPPTVQEPSVSKFMLLVPFIVLAVIGGIVGLIIQWKKTYKKM